MRSLFGSLLGYFLTPGGVVLMGALDSSAVFFMPLGIDFVIIILAARNPDQFWLYGALATVGALVGSWLTFWVGGKIGEHGLARMIKPSRLKRIRAVVGRRAAVSIAALALVPPPFPFTPFILTSGALGVRAWPFFLTLAAARLVRFTAEGALAAKYGERLLRWMDSRTFTIVVVVLATLAIAGTIVSAVAVARSTKKGKAHDG